MKSIPLLIIILVLMRAGSNFCMDKPTLPEVIDSQDGFEWFLCSHAKHFEPYAGKVVAWFAVHNSLEYGAYKMAQNATTCYSVISTKKFNWDGVDFGYHLMLKCQSNGPHDCDFALDGKREITMRLLTLAQARHWHCAVQEKKLILSEDIELTLGNLIPSEQKKYFRNQARKTFWDKQRLLHIGKQDKESQLNCLPKDLIKFIAKQALDAEAEELFQKADLKMLLEFDDPKK